MHASHRLQRLLLLPAALFAVLGMMFVSAGHAEATGTATKAGAVKISEKKLTKAQKKAKKRAHHKARLKRRNRYVAHRQAHRKHKIKKAIKVARHQKGDPYRYGATGPHAFDCSGLTGYAYRKVGLKLPRTSSQQSHKFRRITKHTMHKGDLVFFTHGRHVYHVGIYWGKKHGHKRILHASRPGTPVKVERIWTGSYFVKSPRLARHQIL